MRRLRFVCCFAIVLMAGILTLSLAAPSSAQIKGSCPVTIDGARANLFMTPGTAHRVFKDSYVDIEFSSTQHISGHRVWIGFGYGPGFMVADGADDGTSWSESVEVARYARYGVGLYEVTAETYGEGGCTSTAYFMVEGNPLTTPAGAGGAAAATIGVLGMAGSAVTGSRKGQELAERARETDPYVNPPNIPRRCFGLCAVQIPVALLRTGVFMLSGAGTIGAPVVVTPYISLSALLGSVLAGLGTLVLGQQYAIFFPTRSFSLLWMLGWLAAGFAVPSLARLISVRQANAILAKSGAAETVDQAKEESNK